MATAGKSIGNDVPSEIAPIPQELRLKASTVLALDYPLMKSPLFQCTAIEEQLFGQVPEPALPSTSWYQPTSEELEEEIGNSPGPMSATEERLMFLRFNFAKQRLMEVKQKVDKDGLTFKLAELAVEWHRRYALYREYLTCTNLGLVLAMAKRMRLDELDFAEVVSEGNMALLNTVEKFDVERGYKFSTYACRAILKAFSRTAMKHSRHRTRFPVELQPGFEKSDWVDRRRESFEAECIEELKNIVDRNLAALSQMEQTVIRHHFNWRDAQSAPLTLTEVGRLVGVTKERARQIQNKALSKIRRVMERGVLQTASEGPPQLQFAGRAA